MLRCDQTFDGHALNYILLSLNYHYYALTRISRYLITIAIHIILFHSIFIALFYRSPPRPYVYLPYQYFLAIALQSTSTTYIQNFITTIFDNCICSLVVGSFVRRNFTTVEFTKVLFWISIFHIIITSSTFRCSRFSRLMYYIHSAEGWVCYQNPRFALSFDKQRSVFEAFSTRSSDILPRVCCLL